MIDYNLTIFETSKQVSVTRGTTQIAPASLPIPLFRLQQALCRNAARTERFYLPEKIRRSSFRLRSYKYHAVLSRLSPAAGSLKKRFAGILSVVAFQILIRLTQIIYSCQGCFHK